MDNRVTKTFCELVAIPSPSGSELNVSKYIKNYLKGLGYAPYSDNAGKLNSSNTGNLIVKIGRGNPRLCFIAHMDTVEVGKPKIRPVVSKGVIRSDGTTILGADDKSAVASLLEAVKELSKEKELPTVLLVFSIREEEGVMGIRCLKIEKKIPFVFDVDGSDRVGGFINRALGNFDFELSIYGKEAHAAKNPEKGRNAIKTAGIIISKLKLGRMPNGSTINVGNIAGGTFPNVIPGYCKLIGEVRGFSLGAINKNFEKVREAAESACKMTGCRYKLVKMNGVPPFYTPEANSAIIGVAKRACKAAGIKFMATTLYATIQGNILAEKEYNVLGMCKGGKLPHSKSESITIKELGQTKRLIMELVRQSKE